VGAILVSAPTTSTEPPLFTLNILFASGKALGTTVPLEAQEVRKNSASRAANKTDSFFINPLLISLRFWLEKAIA
jgi:hypothetical protein